MKNTTAAKIAFASVLAIAITRVAHAQWTVTYLPPPDGLVYSAAWGGGGTQVVGEVGTGPNSDAIVWNGNAQSFTDLSPAGATSSSANGISGTQVAGLAYLPNGSDLSHASLWSGTAASWVDLNPAGASGSNATGISGALQAGYAFYPDGQGGNISHAGIWSGTAASWLDLNPAGALSSYANGISGTQVVGSAAQLVNVGLVYQSVDYAALWNGTADSVVYLSPGAVAVATTGTHQVGFTDPGESPALAALWSGTAASYRNLNPAGAFSSEAVGVFGDYQVGWAEWDTSLEDPEHTVAVLWNGTADSWEDLSTALTGSWSSSQAQSIWSDGSTLYIAGFGYNESTESDEAILWSRPVPEPGTAGIFGIIGGLIAMRRRRLTPGWALGRTSGAPGRDRGPGRVRVI